MCRLPPTGIYRYKYSMRNFTGLEIALLVVSSLQLAAGITLLVINSLLIGVKDIFIWGYAQSEAMFGKHPEYREFNYTLVTCALFILGLALFCCGVFGLCGVLMWRYRSTFVILDMVSSLVSFGCFGVLFYVICNVVGYQIDRMNSFQFTYSEIIFDTYSKDPKSRDYLDAIQSTSKCCGYLLPADWLSSPLGYLPVSCCKFEQPSLCPHLGMKLDQANLTKASLAEAYPLGCFAKQRDSENLANVVSRVFYGSLTASGMILQLIGLILIVAYKLTNFSIIMTPTYSTHL